jgi:predicted DNA-binding transcriptional regulator AlpA
VAQELERIRETTELTVADVARICGLKRRQVYNLLDGEPTEPHRAARIRKLSEMLMGWARQFPRPADLRSALFAPLGSDQRDFVTMMEQTEGHDISEAVAAFQAYLDRLNGGRPIWRTSSPSPARAREAVQQLREYSG